LSSIRARQRPPSVLMAMIDGWQDVSRAIDDPVLCFLEGRGLGKFAQQIVEATDAESLDDLKLIDAAMLEEVIRAVGLKLVSAKKLSMAIAELRGETAPPAEEPSSLAVRTCTALGPLAAEQGGEAVVESAGSETTEVTSTAAAQEYIVVCIDRSGSMGAPMAEVTLNVVKGAVTERTRMEAVKAMFYAFRDRAESMGRGTHQMGLIQFDNAVERMLDLTPRLDRFEAIVDDMQKRGSTAIYSSILEAVSMLEQHFHAESKADLRILVLTDGQNNSGAKPEEALEAANRIGAVVDAIIVGNRPDSNLRRIVSATEGECYQINDLGEGFELLEAEGVVSLRARRGGVEKLPFKMRPMLDFDSIAEKSMTKGMAVQRTIGIAQELAQKVVVSLASLDNSSTVRVMEASSASSTCTKRLLAELRQLASGSSGIWMHSGDGVHVFPALDNLSFWRALIEGPPSSPFEDGVFALNVVVPDGYPMRPPHITFETPVYHCNVSDSGKICLDILHDKWNPALSVPKCLEAVRLMLKTPDTDNSLRQWIAELTIAQKKSNGADTRYFDKARECTLKDASMTVDDWKQKWGC